MTRNSGYKPVSVTWHKHHTYMDDNMFEKLLKDAKLKGQRVKDHSKQYDLNHPQQRKHRQGMYELGHPQRTVEYDLEHAQQLKARRATYELRHPQ